MKTPLRVLLGGGGEEGKCGSKDLRNFPKFLGKPGNGKTVTRRVNLVS